MTRSDDLRRLAWLCRENPHVALGVIGYLAGLQSDEVISAAVEWGQELRKEFVPKPGHLELIKERYGAPDPRN